MEKNVEQEHKNIGWYDYIRLAAVTIEEKGGRNTCSWNLEMNKRPSILKRIASTAHIFMYFYVSRRNIMALFDLCLTVHHQWRQGNIETNEMQQ